MKVFCIKVGIGVIVTIFMGLFWLRNPQLFPKPPASIAAFLVEVFDAKDQESVANLEIAYVFFVSSVVAALLVFVFPVKKILTRLSTGR